MLSAARADEAESKADRVGEERRMSKLIVSSFVSLDGAVEDPMTWAHPFFDEEAAQYAQAKLEQVDYFLLGRVAYETFFAAWPKVKGNPYIEHINDMKKLVASNSLRHVGWNGELISGNVAERLREIKATSTGGIIKYGVTNLDQTLLSSRLVDEYHLWIMPVCVSAGKRAFANVDPALIDFELSSTHTMGNGVVVLRYAVRPPFPINP
jgi:dihydrofolate reductase